MSLLHRWRRRHSRVFITMTILILLGLLVPRLFTIRQIECFTQFGWCPEIFTSSMTNLVGLPLFYRLPTSAVHHALAAYPEISTINLHRRLPYTLVVSIRIYRPLGVISSAVLGSAVVVDYDGRTLPSNMASGLPHLTVTSGASKDVLPALQTLRYLTDLLRVNLTAKLDNRGLVVLLPEGSTVFIDPHSSTQIIGSSLQSILSRSKMNGRMPVNIDLRYQDPVLTFE